MTVKKQQNNIEDRNSYDYMQEQDARWAKEVREIMDILQIQYYPSHAQFRQCGKQKVNTEITMYHSHHALAEELGLDTPQWGQRKEKIFDIMLHFGIKYYPTVEQFHRFKPSQKSMYDTIARDKGHATFRKEMKLMSQQEWDEFEKRKK